MKYRIETNYLEHDGGTKFYETVKISEVGGPAMLIKRWGKIAERAVGGQTKIERGDNSTVSEEERKIIADKMKFRTGKGQYVSAPKPNVGFHILLNGAQIDADALDQTIGKLYCREDIDAIKAYFGLSGISGVIASEPEPTPVEEPIVRDETWGSW